MTANSGKRDLLFEGDAEVGAIHHEGQMIERWRDHRVGERRHDRGTRLGRAKSRPRRLDFIAARTGDPDDVGQTERRRQGLGRLRDGADRDEEHHRGQHGCRGQRIH
jgi:hypothetical protein